MEHPLIFPVLVDCMRVDLLVILWSSVYFSVDISDTADQPGCFSRKCSAIAVYSRKSLCQ